MAEGSRAARRRRASEQAAAAAETEPVTGDTPPRSLFGPGDDNVVRGEVVVKLAAPAARAVTASIPTHPLRALTVGLPSGFGIPEVDEVLQRHGAVAVSRVHPPGSPFPSVFGVDRGTLGETYHVRLPTDANVAEIVESLTRLDAVEDAEPNRWREATIVPNDPSFPAQWGLARIRCPDAWDLSTGSPAVVVGVVDTGVDLDHPELAPVLLPGQDMVDLAGAAPPPGTHFEGDWTARDDSPQDEVGHGTHVAGTIACATNNTFGVAGVTWSCRILPVRVLARVVENAPPHRVRGTGSAVDIAAGIRWAVDHGAQVINLSLGGYSDTFVERDAVAYAVAHGVVVVAAMGNDDTNTPSYPAGYPGVVAVGATDQMDRRAPFSNTGPHIAVSAPGVDVLSTVWDDGFASLSGTSMASPHVAGVVALIRSCNSSLSADEVGTILRETARPLRDAPADPVPNDRYGAGLVDAGAAVARACAGGGPMPTQPTFPTVTRPTFPTFPTITRPTFPTRPTLPTFPTRPTFPTFPTRPTFPTFPTVTRPTFPTFPTVTRPTITQPTITQPTVNTVGTFVPGAGGYGGYDPYQQYYGGGYEQYGGGYDPYQQYYGGYEQYGGYDPYQQYYGGYGQFGGGYDPYQQYGGGYGGNDPYQQYGGGNAPGGASG
ncbi:MAG TPA: S8 family serine peptidase [Chloroflexota bacterium]|nr:S8 family serine peptidase [Chloroflexota bacterium]